MRLWLCVWPRKITALAELRKDYPHDTACTFSMHGVGTGFIAITTVSTEDPQFLSAIQACAVALRRMADYELDPSLQRRLRALGERKEFLSQAEHEELLALVDFAHKRTIEKLEAQVALARLRTALPGVLSET